MTSGCEWLCWAFGIRGSFVHFSRVTPQWNGHGSYHSHEDIHNTRIIQCCHHKGEAKVANMYSLNLAFFFFLSFLCPFMFIMFKCFVLCMKVWCIGLMIVNATIMLVITLESWFPPNNVMDAIFHCFPSVFVWAKAWGFAHNSHEHLESHIWLP